MIDRFYFTSQIQRLALACLVSSLGVIDLTELKSKAESDGLCKTINTDNSRPRTIAWEPVFPSEINETKRKIIWKINKNTRYIQNKSPSTVVWELLEESPHTIPTSEETSNPRSNLPSTLEEAEALLNTIPLVPEDYQSLLNLAYFVPTASVLNADDWRLKASTISPFKSATGTGNQNYAIQIDFGLTDTIQVSGFYTEADDPLNALIKGRDVRPGNFWEIFGSSARWQLYTNKKVSVALNGSLERWTVGSGGSDSLTRNGGQLASPNIFNESGKRVTTHNLIGSLSIPMTWYIDTKWQLSLNPGISFLPQSQGRGQGGEGQFYGTNPYISGGILWQATPQLGLTASIAQPFGSGSNNFDRNLTYSKVPVFSGGLNWHLNPRIALQGQLTNGFGATPATALLTLPSDNRLGYSANFIFTVDAPDTPQPPLTARQQSLSLGGLTVNTALVPPDTLSVIKLSTDSQSNVDTSVGFSISNIFQFELYRSKNSNVPQRTIQARTYSNDGAINWRGSGKAILTSPLRDAPVWSALRISLGRNMNNKDNNGQGYLFAETPLTWEAHSNIAFNFNPKVAWSGVGTLWGKGLGANIKVAPRWEVIPEMNVVVNSPEESNGSLALRWNATEDISIEAYGSTASSIVDLGQLLKADAIRWGGRLTIKI